MLKATRIPLLIAALAVSVGCHDANGHSVGITHFEEDFLTEDVIDLMTIVFQASENAFVGDDVLPADIIEPASAGNDFTVTYDLPPDARGGLGFGFGEASLQVIEDGVSNPRPLTFSFATTTAQTVEIFYALDYEGEARSGRPTFVSLDVSLTAVRTGPADFEVDYVVTRFIGIGDTFVDDIFMFFRAAGRPVDGIVGGFGDGNADVDDPDVFEVLDLDLDWFSTGFRAEGELDLFSFYEESFSYGEVL
jgi:hypothetical protein